MADGPHHSHRRQTRHAHRMAAGRPALAPLRPAAEQFGGHAQSPAARRTLPAHRRDDRTGQQDRSALIPSPLPGTGTDRAVLRRREGALSFASTRRTVAINRIHPLRPDRADSAVSCIPDKAHQTAIHDPAHSPKHAKSSQASLMAPQRFTCRSSPTSMAF
ncbi:hypothetical protein BGLA2_190045 [Burkholderia gladioli]|nr:hypothetical protein BGLA2_190045 [Burkholderia gladioli]